MLIDLAEPVLYALVEQARKENRILIVSEAEVGHAIADMDGYGRQVHLKPHGDGHLQVEFS